MLRRAAEKTRRRRSGTLCATSSKPRSSGSRATSRARLESYEKSIELHPELADAFAGRAFAYYAVSRYSDALDDLDRALALEPELGLAFNYRGLVYAATGDIDAALVNLTRAIETEPALTDAHRNRAEVYMHIEDYDSGSDRLLVGHPPGPRGG